MNQYIIEFLNHGILIYAISIMMMYLVLAFISVRALKYYLRKNQSVHFDDILRSPLAPSISIVAPAYNEASSIVDNVRSLLSLHYNNYDIIIVNDGSKDATIAKLSEAYELQEVKTLTCAQLPHKEVLAVYQSTNAAFKKLTVIDKVNGGKSDALNAGINYATGDWVTCVDVDCIIEDDALLKIIKPVLEETSEKVVAVGGVVRIANNCEIKNGRLVKVELAKDWLPIFQTLEYIRAFLLGRMAWGHMNGLLIISGAFGMFDRKLVIEVGGYDTKTVGEDMELVVRMRRRLADQGVHYKVAYVPDPLCWTEAPAQLDGFVKQRNRWTRGTIETLKAHKGIAFKPKYGLMGMLSYPFWFLYEWLAPIIETAGIIYSLLLIAFGIIEWQHFILLIILVYIFSILISWISLYLEETTFREYTRGKALGKLLVASVLEPIIYHPITVYAAIKGNIDKFLLKKKSWGEQRRQGFAR